MANMRASYVRIAFTVVLGGVVRGINANDICLDTGFTVAVMSNYDGGAMPIESKARQLLGNLKDAD